MAAGSIGTAWIQIKPSVKGIGKDISAQLNGELSGATKQTESLFSGLGDKLKLALKAGAVAAGGLIVSQIGGAIRRVDTLANASRTFENMGFSTDVVKSSMDALEKSIKGLPTPLDSAVRGMTSLAATYGDVKAGQKIFTALNNAILGFGGTTDMVNNAILQLSQLPMDGPLDAQTWNSLRNSGLTPVLVAMAKDMGISVNEMKKKFGEGELTVQDFTIALTRMDKEGGGGMKSLQEIARDSTKGIGTSFENMKTAVVRGLAEIINSLGNDNIKQSLEAIGKAFEDGLKRVAEVLPGVLSRLTDFFGFIIRNKDVINSLAVSAMAVYTTFKLYEGLKAAKEIFNVVSAATKGAEALKELKTVTQSATKVQAIFNAVMALNPFVLIVAAIAAVVAGLVWFFTKTETGKKVFEDLKRVALDVWDKIKSAFIKATVFIIKLWDDIKSAVMTAVNFVKNIITTIVGTVAGIVSAIWNIIFPIVELWWTVWRMIFAVVQIAVSVILAIIFTLVGFIWNNVLYPILNAYISIWAAIFNVVSAAIGWIVGIISTLVSFVWNNVSVPILNIFKTLWNMVSTLVSGFVNGAKNVFSTFVSWIKVNIIDKVANFFGTLWDGAKNKATEAFEGVKNIVKGTINWMVDKINFLIKKVNATAGKVPGVPNIAEIPKLAKGGIVSSPTLALIGEGREAEAVIPLSKLDQMLESDGGATTKTTKNVTVNQYNTNYTELDMAVVNRKLTWELNRL